MKNIILTSLLTLCCLVSFAQKTIKGVVKDDTGQPLPGVVVRQSESTVSVPTNANGEFTLVLDNTKKQSIGVFMIGFVTQEIDVRTQSNVTVTLKESAMELQQVVVVGYGEQKKISVTGSISSVNAADINKAPVASVTNALTGRVTGLVTRQSSGRPGQDDAQLFIRGRGTFTSTSPLILVDGVERDFSQIASDDVESISVLKDAAATSVFGVRGANGVVLVTTKRGVQGKSKINFSRINFWCKRTCF